jgi:uncharacterized ferritin-like protein (DUF455 family)
VNDHLPTHHLLRDVDTASLQLRRLYRVLREIMRADCGHILAAPMLDTKRLLARHAWIIADHADALRTRVLELRFPRVDVDDDMPAGWIDFLSRLPRARTSAEFIAGIYRVVLPRVVDALDTYRQGSDAIDDAPSHLILRRAIEELREQIVEAGRFFPQLPKEDRAWVSPWQNYLESCIESLGGFDLASLQFTDAKLPAIDGFTDRPEFVLPNIPARDPNYQPGVMSVPPRAPRNGIESRIWLAIDHANENWAGEVPAGMVWAHGNAEWALLRDTTRWAYDEFRHAMMGERRLRGWGFIPGQDYPVVSDHFSALTAAGFNLHDALLLLHALELSGPHWKRDLVGEFKALGDANSSVDCDYDWADESGHIRVGLAWTRFIYPTLSKQQVIDRHAQLKAFWANWMQARHADGTHGYDRFLPRIEKLAAAMTDPDVAETRPAKLTYGGTDVFDFEMPQDHTPVGTSF